MASGAMRAARKQALLQPLVLTLNGSGCLTALPLPLHPSVCSCVAGVLCLALVLLWFLHLPRHPALFPPALTRCPAIQLSTGFSFLFIGLGAGNQAFGPPSACSSCRGERSGALFFFEEQFLQSRHPTRRGPETETARQTPRQPETSDQRAPSQAPSKHQDRTRTRTGTRGKAQARARGQRPPGVRRGLSLSSNTYN